MCLASVMIVLVVVGGLKAHGVRCHFCSKCHRHRSLAASCGGLNRANLDANMENRDFCITGSRFSAKDDKIIKRSQETGETASSSALLRSIQTVQPFCETCKAQELARRQDFETDFTRYSVFSVVLTEGNDLVVGKYWKLFPANEQFTSVWLSLAFWLSGSLWRHMLLGPKFARMEQEMQRDAESHFVGMNSWVWRIQCH